MLGRHRVANGRGGWRRLMTDGVRFCSKEVLVGRVGVVWQPQTQIELAEMMAAATAQGRTRMALPIVVDRAVRRVSKSQGQTMV
jgi:hypothetical protein